MPEEPIATFSVSRLAVLDEEGRPDEDLLPSLSEEDLVRMYEMLLLTRAFDKRALSLQREGRIGTYPSSLGQEAAQVGSAFALKKTDRIFPSFRELGVYLTLGYPMDLIFRYWAGDERGQACPDGLNIFPICIAVGTHVPHAVGAALASRILGEDAVAACYFGDGATSKGDFHEGLNLAGVYGAPAVFIIQNNQWAISVPRGRQSASKTLAQKALAFGIEGVQVDGNDVLAVYLATRRAVERARSGKGPTLIECETYRMGDHTTADDAGRYRSHEEVERWKGRDPLLRMRRFLEGRGLWDGERQQEAEARQGEAIDRAVSDAEGAQPPRAAEMFDHTYAEKTPRLAKQEEEIGDGGS